MTVNSTSRSVVYIGNGSATTFAFPFPIIDKDHLVVQRRNAATGLVEETYGAGDLSISGVGEATGEVTIAGAALSSNYEILIYREVPIKQELDIVNAGGFYPQSVEDQLDMIVMGVQQVAERNSRSIALAVGETAEELPAAAGRAGKFLGFTAGGDPTVLSGTGADSSLREDLALGGGALLVGHKPSLAPTIAQTLSFQALFNGDLTLASYLTYCASADDADATDILGAANGANWLDLAYAIKQRTDIEPQLRMPAGFLPINCMDFTVLGIGGVPEQARSIHLLPLGTVNIVGTDGNKRFIFGSMHYTDNGPWVGDPPFIRDINIWGPRVRIQPRALSPGVFEQYDHGVRLEAFVDCKLRLGVSGNFGDATANRDPIYLDISFDNEFDFHSSHPGDPGVGFYSNLIFCGPNNVNKNVFRGRLSGPGVTSARVRGIFATGSDNYVRMDVSAVEQVVLEEAGSGNQFAIYAESIKHGYAASTASFSVGTILLGGRWDHLAGGVSRNLNYTKGLTSIGGVRKFTGAGTTDIDFGGNCYSPSIVGGTYVGGSEPTTKVTGLPIPEKNDAGFYYGAEGTFSVANALAAPTGTNVVSWQRDRNWFDFNVTFTTPASADATTAIFTGCPVAPAATSYPTWLPAYDQADRDLELVPLGVNNWRVRKISTGAYQTNAQIAGKLFAGTIRFFVA